MRVYLSSTKNDLEPERQAVKEALGGLCTVVESYTADERSVRDSCWDDVQTCNVYIGIIGRRYGHIPDGESLSITELEFSRAEQHEIHTLIFIKRDDAINSLFHDAVTGENPREKIDAFRQRIQSRAALFSTVADLKEQLLKAWVSYSQRHREVALKRINGCPYHGLRAFQANEADRFFGRDAERDELLERLLAGTRFVAVIGSSGSGKSSLVRAGLIPALVALGGARWFPVVFTPRELSDDPLLPLALAMKNAFPQQRWHAPDLVRQWRACPGDIASHAEAALASASPDIQAQLLLFVDQFEELFAAKVDAAMRASFFALLKATVATANVRVVLSMRSDFYSQWPQDEDSIALLRSGHFPLGVPGAAALEKMIVQPAQAAGIALSPRLVRRILDDTGTAPGALALMEFALEQLYLHRQDGELTEAAYRDIGGVAGAIDGLAEKAVAAAQFEIRLSDETFA